MNFFFTLFGLIGAGAAGSGTGESETDSETSDNDATETDTGSDDGTPTSGDDGSTGGHDGGHGTPTSGDGSTGGHDGGHGTPTSGDGSTGGHGGGHGTPTSGDGSTGGHGGGHDTPAITPPAPGADQATIDAFVAAVRAQGEMHAHAHDHDSGKASEHMAAMNLVPRDEATHIAVSDGDWFDTTTWYNGDIPDAGAKVLIPEGINVQYGTVSDISLFTVRVDGELDFATDVDSKMVFDTMVVSPTGSLVIGTEVDPVAPDVTVDLIVANNGPIDTSWDPTLMSRGLISHGEASIHGAAKDSHEKVVEDPMAGDTALHFETAPEGWAVGDTIVIAGTSYEGHKWDNDLLAVRPYASEDEVRIITDIVDNVIYFDEPLEYDHDTPRDDLKTSVANYTRNVSIETENAETAEIYERGHVMFMHSDDVDVRYAEFHELGRTDKSKLSMQHDDFDTVASDNNVQGRYSLHLHRTGTDDLDNPAIVEGNAVWGSPGWGFVHHDSNAILTNNASFDTFGAGYVAETGNESGEWTDNIAIYAEGIAWGEAKNTSALSDTLFDTARGGDGFYFQGRLVESQDNVAASVNHGFSYFHRGGDDRTMSVNAEQVEFADAYYGRDGIWYDDPPLRDFSGNETFASRQGLAVVKAGLKQTHDVWTHIDDFTAWNVETGVFLEYTTHYLLTDIDVIGKEDTHYNPVHDGIEVGKGTSDIVIVESQIDNFKNGIVLTNDRNELIPAELTNYTIVDTTISGADTDILNYDPSINTITTVDALDSQTPSLDLDPLIFESNIVKINGTKYDGLGETDFPSGLVNIQPKNTDVLRYLEEDGYWTTSDGYDYFLLDVYFTDRLTGEVYYETHTVELTETTTNGVGQWWSDYEHVRLNGVQDITTEQGVMRAGDTVLETPFAATAQSAPPASATNGSGDTGHSSQTHDMSTPTDVTETTDPGTSETGTSGLLGLLMQGQPVLDETMPATPEEDPDVLEEVA